MSRVAIKICGLSTATALDAAFAHGATHAGFVHFPKSPRHLEFDELHALARRAPPEAGRVAVVVDPDDALIDRLLAPGILTALQLHGHEEPARVAAIARRADVEIWKAVSVRTAADVAKARHFAGAAHRILFDAKTPDDADLPGGMGLRFDWTLLSGYDGALPWALSGGLDAINVCQAITQTSAPLVDVSSGVESAPGIKDVDKIAAFCKAVSQC
jgi:phosphoribosylanthranilate isomerase